MYLDCRTLDSETGVPRLNNVHEAKSVLLEPFGGGPTGIHARDGLVDPYDVRLGAVGKGDIVVLGVDSSDQSNHFERGPISRHHPLRGGLLGAPARDPRCVFDLQIVGKVQSDWSDLDLPVARVAERNGRSAGGQHVKLRQATEARLIAKLGVAFAARPIVQQRVETCKAMQLIHIPVGHTVILALDVAESIRVHIRDSPRSTNRLIKHSSKLFERCGRIVVQV